MLNDASLIALVFEARYGFKVRRLIEEAEASFLIGAQG
jgi:hypothetical protein